MVLQDLIVRELENGKSLAALLYLLEKGREVELSVEGEDYFLSRSHASRSVSLWNKQEEQSFDSAEELIENALISGRPFLSAWENVKIKTIF